MSKPEITQVPGFTDLTYTERDSFNAETYHTYGSIVPRTMGHGQGIMSCWILSSARKAGSD